VKSTLSAFLFFSTYFFFQFIRRLVYIDIKYKRIQKRNVNLKRKTAVMGLRHMCLSDELKNKTTRVLSGKSKCNGLEVLKQFHCTLFPPNLSYNLVRRLHILLFSLKSFMSAFVFYSSTAYMETIMLLSYTIQSLMGST